MRGPLLICMVRVILLENRIFEYASIYDSSTKYLEKMIYNGKIELLFTVQLYNTAAPNMIQQIRKRHSVGSTELAYWKAKMLIIHSHFLPYSDCVPNSCIQLSLESSLVIYVVPF